MSENQNPDSEVKKNRIPELYAATNLPGLKVLNTYPSGTSGTRFSIAKETITRAIEQKNIADLRKFSQYFFHMSGEYRRLVEYFAKILTFDYIIVPNGDPTAFSTPKFLKDVTTIEAYASASYIKEIGSTIALSVVKDGAFYGYERVDGTKYILQQLPNEYCRTSYKVGNIFGVEFDFSFFDLFKTAEELKEVLLAFPPEFSKMYKIFLRDKQAFRWQLLDPNFARAHMLSDETPLLSPVLVSIMELDEHKVLDRLRSANEIDQIIVQEVPMDENGNFLMELDEIISLHNNAKSMVHGTSKRILTTPAKIKALDFTFGTRQSTLDDVEKGTRSVYSSAGTPMILFSTMGANGSIGLEKSIKIDEAVMFELLDQFKMWYENRFSNLVKNNKYSFSIIFPPITIFNRVEMSTMYMNAAAAGFPTKLLAAAAIGLNSREFTSLLSYENDYLTLPETMKPTMSSHTATSEEGGRPESKGPLSEEGEKTRDQKKNDNRAEGGT